MRVAFRPEARREALSARDWYEMQVPGLGRRFAQALDAAIESIFRNPGAYRKLDGDCRRILLRRFPYSVIFRVRHDELLVIAVFHHSRRPGAWRRRLI
ncbi:MAG: type II toxin-antitoxin system RelE/ParE family toxin [Gammaproteobacteria bacterium]